MNDDLVQVNDLNPEIDMPEQLDERMLNALRFIILREERGRLQKLELKLTQRDDALTSLESTIGGLHGRLAKQLSSENEETFTSIQNSIDELRNQVVDDPTLATRLEAIITPAISRQISENRDDMAKTIGPVIGESIRVQLRNNREDIVDALYPVIGETVAKSVRESFREFQRSIDHQLRSRMNLRRILRAQIKGVSASELALRESLPFKINHIFLIQHDTGLLINQYQLTDSEMPPGLIGSMLTAIRQFAHDSFGRHGTSSQLDEIQFGDERIIIEGGQHAYVAAVVQGSEPTQFHTALRNYISTLHIDHGLLLAQYDGDVESMAHLQIGLAEFIDTLSISENDDDSHQINMGKYASPIIGGCLLLMLMGLASSIFCLYFVFRLWPIAFGNYSYYSQLTTPTTTTITIASPTTTQTPVIMTKYPTDTPSVTPTHSIELVSTKARTIGNIWVLEEPNVYDKRTGMLLNDTPVILLSSYGDWIELEWLVEETNSIKQGWILARWVELVQPIPKNIITPMVNP